MATRKSDPGAEKGGELSTGENYWKVTVRNVTKINASCVLGKHKTTIGQTNKAIGKPKKTIERHTKTIGKHKTFNKTIETKKR